jgi:aryl-alcohol dehydrogenase-like predicted oxidoreductase
MGAEAGVEDRRGLAQAAIRWCLSHEGITSLTVGTGNPDHLRSNLGVVESPGLGPRDEELISAVRAKSPTFHEFEAIRSREFLDA